MSWSRVRVVFLKEIREALRDRRTMISTIIIPSLVVPVLLFGVGRLTRRILNQARDETPTVMVVAGNGSRNITLEIEAARDSLRDRPLFRITSGTDYEQEINSKKIRAAVAIPDGFDAALDTGAMRTIDIFYYQGDLRSALAAEALERFFAAKQRSIVERRIVARGVPVGMLRPFDISRRNVAPPEKVGGAQLGGLIPYLLIILCFTGAMYPAIDVTAGEKERRTMETVLSSPISRLDLVLGKFLLAMTGSIAAVFFMLLSLVGTAFAVGTAFVVSGAALQATQASTQTTAAGYGLPVIDPLGVVGALAMVFPVAAIFSATALSISLFAKTYKEAQSYLAPLLVVVLLPAVVGLLPGIELNGTLALVPLLNISLACKEMLSGTWHWNYLALIFLSSCVYAGATLAYAVRLFNREDVIFRV